MLGRVPAGAEIVEPGRRAVLPPLPQVAVAERGGDARGRQPPGIEAVGLGDGPVRVDEGADGAEPVPDGVVGVRGPGRADREGEQVVDAEAPRIDLQGVPGRVRVRDALVALVDVVNG